MARLMLMLLFATLVTQAEAWSPAGHHLITLLAYDLLEVNEQQEVRDILADHPRYAEDFNPPKDVNNAERWRIGKAGQWPDYANKFPEYRRKKWHYQLAVTTKIGSSNGVKLPTTPEGLPIGADMTTEELHVEQALLVCTGVLSESSRTAGERSLALCWIAHLAADSHQPCHSGSLYAPGIFPEGDRGGNSIETVQGRNLHALWDGLLGRRYDEASVNRRLAEIKTNSQLMEQGQKFLDKPDTPSIWLATSRQLGGQAVYSPEVLSPVRAVSEGKMEELPALRLSPEYLAKAGAIAPIQACAAGHRLAAVWRQCLTTARKAK